MHNMYLNGLNVQFQFCKPLPIVDASICELGRGIVSIRAGVDSWMQDFHLDNACIGKNVSI